MKKLNNENIVKLIDYVESSTNCYIIMEYCNQGDLETLLEKQHFIPEQEALVHFQEILNGFQVTLQNFLKIQKCMQKNNIIHRDFKTANVMINDGIFKIGDFGFAKESYQAITILGTPLYMSPEILQKKKYTNKTDIWSIGVLFYQVLFGIYPFDGNTEKELLNNILKNKLNLNYNGIKISETTKDLLQKMLVVDPGKRIEWVDLFSHPALNKEEEQLNIDNSIENMWMMSQFNLKNKHKLKDQAEFYKQKQFLITQPIDLINYQIKAPLSPNKLEESPQQKEQNLDDQLKKLLLRYQHEKKIYEQIGITMKSAFPLLPENDNLIFYFALTKQYLILSNNLLQSLNNGNNIFSDKFFNQFLKSEYFQELTGQILNQFNKLHEFFNAFLAQINKLMPTSDFNQKNYAIIKDLKEHSNTNFSQNSFNEFYSSILRDYYIKMNEKALNQEKTNLKNDSLKYYRFCYQILDCILMPNNYPYESKNKEGNLMIFDFVYYNNRIMELGLEQIKQEIEDKFMQTLSK